MTYLVSGPKDPGATPTSTSPLSNRPIATLREQSLPTIVNNHLGQIPSRLAGQDFERWALQLRDMIAYTRFGFVNKLLLGL